MPWRGPGPVMQQQLVLEGTSSDLAQQAASGKSRVHSRPSKTLKIHARLLGISLGESVVCLTRHRILQHARRTISRLQLQISPREW